MANRPLATPGTPALHAYIMSRLVSAATVGVCLLLTGASGASLRAATDPAEADEDLHHDNKKNFRMALNPKTQQLADSLRERLETILDNEVSNRADAVGVLDQRLEKLERKQKDVAFAYETAMTGSEELDVAYDKSVQAAEDSAKAQLAPFAAATEKSLASLKTAQYEKNMFDRSLKEANAKADAARISRDEVLTNAHAEFDKVHNIAENTYKSVAERIEDAWVQFQKTSKDRYDTAATECEQIFTSREAAFRKDKALIESMKPDLLRLTELCAAAPDRFLETGESRNAESRRATRGRAVPAEGVKCEAARKKLLSSTGGLLFLQLPSLHTTRPTAVENSDFSLAERLANWEHAVAQEQADATAAKKKCISDALDMQSTAQQHVLKHKNEEMAQAKKNLKAEFNAAKSHLDETKKEARAEVEDASEPLSALGDNAEASSAAWSEAKAKHDGNEQLERAQKMRGEADVREAKRKAKDARDAAFEFQKSISKLAYENEMEDSMAKRNEMKLERNNVAAEMGKSLQAQEALLAALGDRVELPDMTGSATGGKEEDFDMAVTSGATGAGAFSVMSSAFGGATGIEYEGENIGDEQ